MESASSAELTSWLFLVGLVIALLFIDLVVVRSRGGVMRMREAAIASGIWIALALSFSIFIYSTLGSEAGEAYLAGYLIEKSLSLDNVFVFLLVMTSFRVPAELQHRLLSFGILGALVLRAVFIVVGAAALNAFSWMSFPFAAVLLWTGYRLWKSRHSHQEEDKLVDRIAARMPMTKQFNGYRLLVSEHGKRLLTPAGGALLGIMLVDILFAVDSVPAILAITTDTYVVWAANAFALLGLRPLYFLVARLVERLYYLKTALAFLLVFVGMKLIAGELIGKISPTVSLGVIAAILLTGAGASLIRERRITGHW